MDYSECKKLCVLISTYYPAWQKDSDKEQITKAWYAVLKSRDYLTMQKALLAFIETDTSGFAPNIGQLLEKYRQVTQGREVTSAEVWSLVLAAIRDSSYHAEERFAELPPEAQAAIGSAEWLKWWNEDSIQEAEFRFTQNFKVAVNRQREDAVMSIGVKQNRLALPVDDRADKVQAALAEYIKEGEEKYGTQGTVLAGGQSRVDGWIEDRKAGW